MASDEIIAAEVVATSEMKDDKMKFIIGCWKDLNSDNYKADRAEIRRCGTLSAIQLTPFFNKRIFRAKDSIYSNDERFALTVGLLAHVKFNSMDKLADSLKLKVSELRFRRLLQIDDKEDFLRTFRRIISLLDNKVNVRELINTAYWWWDGDKTKRELARNYYTTK